MAFSTSFLTHPTISSSSAFCFVNPSALHSELLARSEGWNACSRWRVRREAALACNRTVSGGGAPEQSWRGRGRETITPTNVERITSVPSQEVSLTLGWITASSSEGGESRREKGGGYPLRRLVGRMEHTQHSDLVGWAYRAPARVLRVRPVVGEDR